MATCDKGNIFAIDFLMSNGRYSYCILSCSKKNRFFPVLLTEHHKELVSRLIDKDSRDATMNVENLGMLFTIFSYFKTSCCTIGRFIVQNSGKGIEVNLDVYQHNETDVCFSRIPIRFCDSIIISALDGVPFVIYEDEHHPISLSADGKKLSREKIRELVVSLENNGEILDSYNG